MPDYLERGRRALKDCGLESKEDEYIWQLSGGQTHLLALAGAVSLEPEVLILDEPIAQLDPRHADMIYRILKDLNERLGKTIIVIEHHTEYIANYCKHVMLLKEGHVEWTLPVKEALDRVEELQASNVFPPQITQAAYHLKHRGRLPEDIILPSTISAGEEIFRNLTFVEPQIQENVLKEVPEGNDLRKCGAQEKEVSVSFRDVTVSYRSVKGEPRKIYEHLNLDLHKGEKIALIGSNGAGKSTMMKLMTGLIKPNEGHIFLKGVPTTILAKVATVSLASITVFSGLDPDRLSNGLMWFGCPERLSFSISYAYRILPMLMEEFQNVLLSYRLRGRAPEGNGFVGKLKYLIYQIQVIMHSFYPLMLNTAKRSRTTVEALEIRGYRYAATNKAVKKMKLSSLKVTYDDMLFLAISCLWMAIVWVVMSYM